MDKNQVQPQGERGMASANGIVYKVGALTFKTQEGLKRALLREGAKAVEFKNTHTLGVRWDAGVEEYVFDRDGNAPLQLRYDFYPDRRVA